MSYLMFWGFIFGAITSSFLCVVAERVPKKQTLGGRSQCACGRQLLVRENIPILGWLMVMGKAKCCGAKLPVFYLLAEIFLAVAWCLAPLFGWWGVLWMIATGGALVGVGMRVLKDAPGATS